MKIAMATSVIAGLGVFGALLFGAMFWHVEVRHSAPYGFSKTVDFDRLIAVPGGYVTANYPDFNRLDLDLRAYDIAADYDLTIHIRPARAGAGDVRMVRLDIAGSRIPNEKGAFQNPFFTVRFPPIPDSAGQTYYVWVERGVRNRDDVITVWSIKSYSKVPARMVLAAQMAGIDHSWGLDFKGLIAYVLGCCLAILGGLASASLVWCGWNVTLSVPRELSHGGPADLAYAKVRE